MNYYEQKMLQDREAHLLSASINLTIFALPVAFILALIPAYFLQLPYQPVFYAIWAALEIFGVLGVIGAIREKIVRKRNINN